MLEPRLELLADVLVELVVREILSANSVGVDARNHQRHGAELLQELGPVLLATTVENNQCAQEAYTANLDPRD